MDDGARGRGDAARTGRRGTRSRGPSDGGISGSADSGRTGNAAGALGGWRRTRGSRREHEPSLHVRGPRRPRAAHGGPREPPVGPPTRSVRRASQNSRQGALALGRSPGVDGEQGGMRAVRLDRDVRGMERVPARGEGRMRRRAGEHARQLHRQERGIPRGKRRGWVNSNSRRQKRKSKRGAVGFRRRLRLTRRLQHAPPHRNWMGELKQRIVARGHQAR